MVIGDPECAVVKSFWFNFKCTYCGDFFSYVLQKRILKLTLGTTLVGQNMIKRALEDAYNAKNKHLALTIGKRGRPAQKSIGAVNSNQKDLHVWFRSGGDSSQEGESLLLDHSHLLGLMCWSFRGPTCVYAGNTYSVE